MRILYALWPAFHSVGAASFERTFLGKKGSLSLEGDMDQLPDPLLEKSSKQHKLCSFSVGALASEISPSGKVVKLRGLDPSLLGVGTGAKFHYTVHMGDDCEIDRFADKMLGSDGEEFHESPGAAGEGNFVSVVDFLTLHPERLWSSTIELLELLGTLSDEGFTLKQGIRDVIVVTDSPMTVSDEAFVASTSADVPKSPLPGVLRDLRFMALSSPVQDKKYLHVIESSLGQLESRFFETPADYSSIVARFTAGLSVPARAVPLPSLMSSLSSCKAVGQTAVPEVATCAPQNKAVGQIQFTSADAPISATYSVLYYSSTTEYVLKVPSVMKKTTAATLCRERVFLRELAAGGYPVIAPIDVIDTTFAAGCDERVLLRPAHGQVWTNARVESLTAVEQMDLGKAILETLTALHASGMALGEVRLSIFTGDIDNIAIGECAFCQTMDGSAAVVPEFVDEDEPLQSNAELADFAEGLATAIGGDVGAFWTALARDIRRGQDMGTVMTAIAVKRAEVEASAPVRPERRRSMNDVEALYKDVDAMTARCMANAKAHPWVGQSCTPLGTLQLVGGPAVEFSAVPLGAGQAGTAFMSTDGKFVAKILSAVVNKTPLGSMASDDLCRERAVVRALAGAGLAVSVNMYEIDWLGSGKDAACDGVVAVMENGGEFSLKGRVMEGSVALEVGARMTEILKQVHQLGILHLDTNMGNFVFSDPADIAGTLRIIDFGFAKRLFDESTWTIKPASPTVARLAQVSRKRDVLTALTFLRLLVASGHPRADTVLKDVMEELRKGSPNEEPMYEEIAETLRLAKYNL